MVAENKARVCVPICERNALDLSRAINLAAEIADLIELRLDCLDETQFEAATSAISAALARRKCPIIITFRPAEQGGARALTLEDRILFRLKESWSHENHQQLADYVDIELDLAVLLKKRVVEISDQTTQHTFDWNRIICSHHDFAGVPANLEQIYEQLALTPARILKIAVQAADVTDCLPIFRLLDRARREGREMIAIAMGPAGVATRILGPSRGSFLTYGALAEGTGTAPGQVTAHELKETYRIEKITERTRIVGLVGLPTGHSISPHVHNAAFEAAGVDAVYLRFEVRDLNSFITRMVDLRSREIDWNLCGLSITAPHKSAVMKYLDWVEPAAKEIGAVNTILVEADALHGYNTDAQGMIEPLLQRVGSLTGLRCAVIGAGGAARTAAWVLRREGVRVKIFARQIGKARALAEEFGVEWALLDNTQFGEFDVVVNATPLGTLGQLQSETTATADQLHGARLAYDLVYNPSETQFMREAREAGCETLGGLSMLVTQATAQFRLWTGVDPPRDVMMNAAEKALGMI